MSDKAISNVIISTIPIPDLVGMLADELERRAAMKAAPLNESPPLEAIRLYGDKAAAKHIGCTPQVIGKLRKAGKIRYYSLGTRYYFYALELDQDLQGGKHRFGELRGRRVKK